MRGVMGGWSYGLDMIVARRPVDYRATRAVIWRSERITIKGMSGGALVRRGESIGNGQYDYHIVGFQSHEIPDTMSPRTIPQIYWKVALPPPEKLTETYLASAPGETCSELDMLAWNDLNVPKCVR